MTHAVPAVCQVETCSRLALQALADDMCCVIGLQSTGEANTTSAREMADVSTALHYLRVPLCAALYRSALHHFLPRRTPSPTWWTLAA